MDPTMPAPFGFSWIKRPLLAALARPTSKDDLEWLRQQGIQVLLSLTEDPIRRDWVNDAGLMVVHEPIMDMEAPTLDQLVRCVLVIERAHEQNLGVAVHCTAGMGRTGTILAGYLVRQGISAADAVTQIRRSRPGSIETSDQEEVIERFAREERRGSQGQEETP